MTLAIFLPLILAAVAIIDLIAFSMMRQQGKISDRVFNLLALASVALPFIAYLVLAVIVPDVGAMEMF
jgi:ABC-type dipeptide/oligopeptide/nickel transport system permease component